MFKLSVSQGTDTATIALPVDTANESSAWLIDSSEFGHRVRLALVDVYGAFGHILGKETTAIDLHAALMQSPFQVEILEGAELVAEYDPQIPTGALT